MPPFSFAHLPQICPPARAQRSFPSHWFRREAGGRRQGEPPSKAGQRSAGENGADGFLCHSPFRGSGCRKSGLRHFFEVFIAPLRLRRGQGAMQGNPCYARLFADLTHTPQGAFSCPFGTIHLVSPNPIIASVGAKPSAASGGRSEAEAQ